MKSAKTTDSTLQRTIDKYIASTIGMTNLPYAALNLKCNPFGELDRQHRIDVAVPRRPLEQLIECLRLDEPLAKSAIQFIGRPGSGKSTHLLLLANHLSEFRYLHIPKNCRRAVPTSTTIMVDEAQRLTRLQCKTIFRSSTKLIFGTHRNFSRQLRANGFQVQTVSLDEKPSASWLRMALNRRIFSTTRCQQTNTFTITEMDAITLINRFGNNIRAIESELYERFCAMNQRDHHNRLDSLVRPSN